MGITRIIQAQLNPRPAASSPTASGIRRAYTAIIQSGDHIFIDTTENWNAQPSYIPSRGDIIIYSDHGQIDDGYGNPIDVPGIKVGDGSAYLIDQPFVGDDVRYQILTELRAHSGNTMIHVTPEEKQFWNNKLNCSVNNGNLILNRQ